MANPRPRLLLVILGLLAALFVVGYVDGVTPQAPAQEGADEGEKAAPTTAPTTQKTTRGFWDIMRHMLHSVGLVFGVILGLVSVALVTLVVLLVLELRMTAAIPPSFVEDFTETVNKRRFKEAYELAKDDPSFVARVLAAGMARLQYGIEDAREASFSMLESVKAGKEQLIVYLATIGTLGPLLGLVGTVFGMILSFMTLSAGQSINAQQLADDISHALVITLLGIAMSVPAIFFHAFFKNRLIRITHDAGNVADDLLTQMYYNSKKPATAAAEVAADTRAAVPPPPQTVKPK
jgi:biopolymer transport protein ExbB